MARVQVEIQRSSSLNLSNSIQPSGVSSTVLPVMQTARPAIPSSSTRPIAPQNVSHSRPRHNPTQDVQPFFVVPQSSPSFVVPFSDTSSLFSYLSSLQCNNQREGIITGSPSLNPPRVPPQCDFVNKKQSQNNCLTTTPEAQHSNEALVENEAEDSDQKLPPIPPGSVVQGHIEPYLLEKKFQECLYGVVYRGKGLYSGDIVAVKLLLKEKIKENELDRELPETPLAEVFFAPHLHGHPNTFTIREVFEVELFHFVVSDLAQGEDLLELLKLHPSGMPENFVRFFMSQAAQALFFGHSRRVVMHDFSLENCLLFVDGAGNYRIRVCDPGQAIRFKTDRNGEEIPVSYTGCVGKKFRPPEIFSKKPYLASRVDSWCLGWSTFYLLFAVEIIESVWDGDRDVRWKYFRSYRYEELFHKFGITERFSPLARDFVLRLMHPSPELRMTIAEALRHPFLSGPGIPSSLGPNHLRGPNQCSKGATTAIPSRTEFPAAWELRSLYKDQAVQEFLPRSIEEAREREISVRQKLSVSPIIPEVYFKTYAMMYCLHDKPSGTLLPFEFSFTDEAQKAPSKYTSTKRPLHLSESTKQSTQRGAIISSTHSSEIVAQGDLNNRSRMTDQLLAIEKDIEIRRENGLLTSKVIDDKLNDQNRMETTAFDGGSTCRNTSNISDPTTCMTTAATTSSTELLPTDSLSSESTPRQRSIENDSGLTESHIPSPWEISSEKFTPTAVKPKKRTCKVIVGTDLDTILPKVRVELNHFNAADASVSGRSSNRVISDTSCLPSQTLKRIVQIEEMPRAQTSSSVTPHLTGKSISKAELKAHSYTDLEKDWFFPVPGLGGTGNTSNSVDCKSNSLGSNSVEAQREMNLRSLLIKRTAPQNDALPPRTASILNRPEFEEHSKIPVPVISSGFGKRRQDIATFPEFAFNISPFSPNLNPEFASRSNALQRNTLSGTAYDMLAVTKRLNDKRLTLPNPQTLKYQSARTPTPTIFEFPQRQIAFEVSPLSRHTAPSYGNYSATWNYHSLDPPDCKSLRNADATIPSRATEIPRSPCGNFKQESNTKNVLISTVIPLSKTQISNSLKPKPPRSPFGPQDFIHHGLHATLPTTLASNINPPQAPTQGQSDGPTSSVIDRYSVGGFKSQNTRPDISSIPSSLPRRPFDRTVPPTSVHRGPSPYTIALPTSGPPDDIEIIAGEGSATVCENTNNEKQPYQTSDREPQESPVPLSQHTTPIVKSRILINSCIKNTVEKVFQTAIPTINPRIDLFMTHDSNNTIASQSPSITHESISNKPVGEEQPPRRNVKFYDHGNLETNSSTAVSSSSTLHEKTVAATTTALATNKETSPASTTMPQNAVGTPLELVYRSQQSWLAGAITSSRGFNHQEIRIPQIRPNEFGASSNERRCNAVTGARSRSSKKTDKEVKLNKEKRRGKSQQAQHRKRKKVPQNTINDESTGHRRNSLPHALPTLTAGTSPMQHSIAIQHNTRRHCNQKQEQIPQHHYHSGPSVLPQQRLYNLAQNDGQTVQVYDFQPLTSQSQNSLSLSNTISTSEKTISKQQVLHPVPLKYTQYTTTSTEPRTVLHQRPAHDFNESPKHVLQAPATGSAERPETLQETSIITPPEEVLSKYQTRLQQLFSKEMYPERAHLVQSTCHQIRRIHQPGFQSTSFTNTCNIGQQQLVNHSLGNITSLTLNKSRVAPPNITSTILYPNGSVGQVTKTFPVWHQSQQSKINDIHHHTGTMFNSSGKTMEINRDQYITRVINQEQTQQNDSFHHPAHLRYIDYPRTLKLSNQHLSHPYSTTHGTNYHSTPNS